jgi:hypothetical protein
VDTCAVIQEEYRPLEVTAIAPILAELLGLVPFDAVKQVREAHGIIAAGLPPDRATRLKARLEQAGIAVRIIPQGTVVRIGKPRIVRLVEIGAAALGVVWGYAGAPEPLPWDNIHLLTAGAIMVTETGPAPAPKKRRKPGISVTSIAADCILPGLGNVVRAHQPAGRPQGGPARVVTSTHSQHLLDLFALGGGGEFLHIRMQSRDLYYDRILGAEAGRDFYANFRLVATAIAAKAVRAQVSPETLALLQPPDRRPADAADPDFGDLNEFTQYNRWLLQMMQVNAGGRG